MIEETQEEIQEEIVEIKEIIQDEIAEIKEEIINDSQTENISNTTVAIDYGIVVGQLQVLVATAIESLKAQGEKIALLEATVRDHDNAFVTIYERLYNLEYPTITEIEPQPQIEEAAGDLIEIEIPAEPEPEPENKPKKRHFI
jgi:hypothetical protein